MSEFDYPSDDERSVLPQWLESDSLAPPCPSPPDVVECMLALASVGPEDTLVDLGAGDGRLAIAAVRSRQAASARGVEIEPAEAENFEAGIAALEADVRPRVRCVCGDLLEHDISDATVVTTYLLPEALAMPAIREKLVAFLRLPGDRRLICNTWGIKGLEPSETAECGPYGGCSLFLYNGSAVAEGDGEGAVPAGAEEPAAEPAVARSTRTGDGDGGGGAGAASGASSKLDRPTNARSPSLD